MKFINKIKYKYFKLEKNKLKIWIKYNLKQNFIIKNLLRKLKTKLRKNKNKLKKWFSREIKNKKN